MARDAGIAIRFARLDDLPSVERIERASFADAWSLQTLATELVEDGLRLPLIALRRGEVVGYLMAWRFREQIHLLNVAVDESARRMGVATALLAAAAAVGARENREAITLEVRLGNRAARAFYERHGFAQVGVRPGYYPDTDEDALVLRCPIASLVPSPGGAGDAATAGGASGDVFGDAERFDGPDGRDCPDGRNGGESG